MSFAFVLMPFSVEFDDVYHGAIKPGCERAGITCERVDEQIFDGSIVDRIYSQIRKSDLVIADLSGRNPNVFYEVGLAHAMGKTTILLTQDLVDVPFDLRQYPLIVYHSLRTLSQEIEKRITRLRQQPASHPKSRRGAVTHRPGARETELRSQARQARKQQRAVRNQLFVSYSHKDLKWLKRLQVHLKPLERENQVRRWDDTMLGAGDEWRQKIKEAVNVAKIAVLLVSADFIASEFVHTNELPPLLAAAETEGAVILPVIVSPSRFDQIKNLSRFHAFNPPSRPLINLTRTQQEQLFVDLTTRIAEVLSPA